MQTYYALMNTDGKYMRRYIRTYTAADLTNAEIFRTRGAAAKANAETKHLGMIVKLEINIIR